eukprot:NODE_463_length_8163_cov_0.168279.p3 type:complete len:107 gc:universal NODE_463_length_8163_cov_0.168279:3870-4190(+)
MFSLFSAVLSIDSTSCLNACPLGDVNCQAKCLGNPFPDASVIAKTNECYRSCASDVTCIQKCDFTYVTGTDMSANSTSSDVEKVDSKSSSSMITTSALILAALSAI